MWKVGLVGTGFWSEKHLKAWGRIPDVEIHALCNRSPEKLEKKAKEFGVPEEQLYSTIEEMLERSGIDIVDICTGPETHLEMVKSSARAGKHIMCQKPFARTLEEAVEMVRIADSAGVRLMVTENWRWLQPIQLIKRELEKGTVGKISSARYMHSDYFTARMSPDMFLPQPFLTQMPRLLFYEMGVHWYDTWRYLFGEPKRLYAELKSASPYVKGEDSGMVMLGYDHYYGLLDMSWATRRDIVEPLEKDAVVAHHKESFVIDGEKATIKLYADGRLSVIGESLEERILTEKTELDHEESHFRLQSHFIECLESGAEFQTSGADNLKTLRLAFGTYESAEEHKVLFL